MEKPDLLRARRMANRCLEKAQVTTLPVDPLALLRKCRNTRVMTVGDAAEMLHIEESQLLHMCAASDAWTYREQRGDEVRYVTLYRTDGRMTRLRFSLAHELGHLVLGHTGMGAWEEQEADMFAGCLLCPESMVEHIKLEGKCDTATLAELFFVSESCAQRAMMRGNRA